MVAPFDFTASNYFVFLVGCCSNEHVIVVAMKQNTKKWIPATFITILFLLGLFARLKLYADNRSLWLDEAYISLDIVANSFGALLRGESIFPWQGRPLVGVRSARR